MVQNEKKKCISIFLLMFDFDKSKWQLDPSEFEDSNEDKVENIYIKVAYCVQKSTGRKYIRKKKTINTLNSLEMKIRFDTNVYMLATNEHPAIAPFLGIQNYNIKFTLKTQVLNATNLYFIIIFQNKVLVKQFVPKKCTILKTDFWRKCNLSICAFSGYNIQINFINMKYKPSLTAHLFTKFITI